MFNHIFLKALDETIKNATTAEIPDMNISTMGLSGLSEEQEQLINGLEFVHNKICKPLVERGVRLRMLREELDKLLSDMKELIKENGGVV